MSCNKPANTRYQIYYAANKEMIKEKNRVYYQFNRDRLLEKYQDTRDTRLAQQKKYAQKNKQKIADYNAQYYQLKKSDEAYKERARRNARAYSKKKKVPRIPKIKSVDLCIKRTKRLMAKMCRELLRKVPLFVDVVVSKPKPEPIPPCIPFAGIRTDSRGYFVLDW